LDCTDRSYGAGLVLVLWAVGELAAAMIPRTIVEVIYNRIEELDFGYESGNTPDDTWRAALDIASTAGLITTDQRTRIEIEDRNQRTLERWAERIRAQRRWEAMTPEQQEHERWMHESFRAQSKVLMDMYYRRTMDLAFKMPPLL
jgi:hypothetical protein